jgi:two-component system sensor histidine kinase UhpB
LVHNRELAQRLIVVQENERRVLARDLHDEIGQNCTAIRAEARFILHAGDCAHAQTLDDANAWASPGGPMMASAQRIEHAAQILHAMVHDMLLRLRPPALDSLGLEAALQTLCESWETQSGIACGFFPVNLPVQLGDATAVAVFRLVQESLTNVARHAGATQVIVRLSRTIDGTRLRLHVQDDGCGLVEGSARKSHTALGQMGMRERVAALQGTIDFVSQPGAGLCVSVEMPLVVEESLS